MQVGDTIQWDTVKGVVDGVVESVAGTRCLARLDNGKCVIVDHSSIIENGKEKD